MTNYGAIKHIVVLMMENRSFDHMLGSLQTPSFEINGLADTHFNPTPDGVQVPTTDNAHCAGDLEPGPAHDFLDVQEQVFSNPDGTLNPTPTMGGFVRSYAKQNSDRADMVMRCFAPGALPALHALARNYTVCSNWFSSVPGPTLPNRAFVHAATSLGRVDMSPDYFKGLRTVYEQFDTLRMQDGRARPTYRIYYNDSTLLSAVGYLNVHLECLTDYWRFADDCEHGHLASYSFIEPQYKNNGGPASDQHPDHDVMAGDAFIADVYKAIASLNKETWESTLLVITYDEHGGLFDHVPPPAAPQPDNYVSTLPAFNFDRLGVRVPAVLVSAYTPHKVDRTVYDHTSILATARKLLVAETGYAEYALTARDRQASVFDGCLALSAPQQPISLPAQPAPIPAQSAGPVNDHQRALLKATRMLEATLPSELQTGTNIHRIFSEADASAYTKEVMARARRHSASAATAGN